MLNKSNKIKKIKKRKIEIKEGNEADDIVDSS